MAHRGKDIELLVRRHHKTPVDHDRGLESPDDAARVIAVATVVIALVFVAYAWSGADLCLWCAVLGR